MKMLGLSRIENGLCPGARPAGLPAGDHLLHLGSINTKRSRDNGQVNVEVMLRPVGTTENVLIDLCIGGNA